MVSQSVSRMMKSLAISTKTWVILNCHYFWKPKYYKTFHSPHFKPIGVSACSVIDMEKTAHPSLLDKTADMPMWTTHEGSQLACFNYVCAQSSQSCHWEQIFLGQKLCAFPFCTERVWHIAWYTRIFDNNIKGNKEDNSFLLQPESL